MSWWQDFRDDLAFGLRLLRLSPAFTAVAALSLALGIGVNTVTFSLVNSFLRPLPVPSPEQIVVLAADTKGDEAGFQTRFSYGQLRDFRAYATDFKDVFAFHVDLSGLSYGGKTTQIFFSAVSGNYFTGLGLRPALGRFFVEGEGESSGAPLSVVLGHSYWRKRFGGDPSIVGRTVRIDRRVATVVGVVPSEFHGLYQGVEMDAYLTMNGLGSERGNWRREHFVDRSARPWAVVGRLKPGVSLTQAERGMRVIAQRLAREYPVTDAGIGIDVFPETLARPFPLRSVMKVLPLVRTFILLMSGLVLLLACMNVANLLLVRATVRQRELAIRAALGSGRGRLIRQMLAESLLLTLLGAAAGIAAGYWTSRMLGASLPRMESLSIALDPHFDWSVFAYTLTAAMGAVAFIGIMPVLRASRTDAAAALHDGSRSNSGGRATQRARSLLVVCQVAGSLVLLVSAGLFTRALNNARRIDLGFAVDHLLNARINPDWAGYNATETENFYRELKRRVKGWPEVRSATFAFAVPMGLILGGERIEFEGRPPARGTQPPLAGCNYVDPDYFDTMGIPLLRGRGFREQDTATAPHVAVVNETMARTFWPNQDPIGRHFNAVGERQVQWEVVGVARDSKYLSVVENSLRHFYLPLDQQYTAMRILQLRTSVPPESLEGRLEREIRAMDPNLPEVPMQTMEDVLTGVQGFLVFRIGAYMMASLGILGLVLAMVGIYGTVSYGVVQRTREIGIRLALGATPRIILRTVLGRGIGLILAGVGAGLLIAALVSRTLGRWLVLVSTTDPLTFTLVPALLAIVVLWACFLPARHAMRVDPMVALRHE